MALISVTFLAEWSANLTIFSLLATYASWKVSTHASLLMDVFTHSHQLICALYWSPLRNFPGPLSAKLSGGHLLFVDIAGRRAKSIEALHRIHGPVVQIGPNEISFDSIEAVDIILWLPERMHQSAMVR